MLNSFVRFRKNPVLLVILASLLAFGSFCLTGCTSPAKQYEVNLSAEAITPSSYEEMYDLMVSIQEKTTSARGYAETSDEIKSTAESATAENTASDSVNSSGSSNYSETNIQVEGIDEADIVKTDGENIYFVSGSDVVIASAAGQETEEISRISLATEVLQAEGITDEAIIANSGVFPLELYVTDSTLMVIYRYYPELLFEGDKQRSYPYSHPVSSVALFAIADAKNPSLIKNFGQDGSYSTSRFQDGILYLVSTYYQSLILGSNSGDPKTYVPQTYLDSVEETIRAQDICILPDSNSLSFTVVTSIDVGTAERVDTQSVLGANRTAYMSYDNLYLGGGRFEEIEQKSYKDGSFTVKEAIRTYITQITRLSLDKGIIELGAVGAIEGSLLNQFSLDEYKGYLRVVTTVNANAYRILEDDKGKTYDHSSSKDIPTSNALFVLDEKLNVVGSIERLAQDEQIYSVRFDGEVGYFVTFKQVDPLFAVDLSNPTKPTVKSALKIPGFSRYLHLCSPDRLLGLGMDTTETGRTTKLKLSMFDTADPYNVNEKYVLRLSDTYSSALSDHKSVFIDQAHDIIGFPVSNDYTIYGYSDKDGFYPRARFINTSTTAYSSTRGLYVEDYLYICSPSKVGVYTLDTLAEVKQIPIEVKASKNNYYYPLVVE